MTKAEVSGAQMLRRAHRSA